MKVVRIGGASAFMVDSITAAAQLLTADPVPDYLIFDFMAEGTIGMMARSRQAGQGGYANDIITFHIGPNLPQIVASKVKIIANAGGMNPKGCAEAIEAMLKERGVTLKVGYVEGDDILAREADLRAAGTCEMFSGEVFPEKVDSINVYLGAFPIAQALAEGADIVITGRCADSALALGPLIHEFDWGMEDWDMLAAGTLVGHLIECGCQVSGGTFTDWDQVPDWENIGYPLADVREDGSCVITKPDGTGGLVSVGTVAEQLLYEVSDPQAYIVPDVVCDFAAVKLEQIGQNRVAVSGARGYPATDSYKGVASYDIGWRATFAQIIIGMDAVAKAERQATAIIERGRRLLRGSNFGEFTRTDYDMIGAGSSYAPGRQARDVREVYMRASVDHKERQPTELFMREAFATMSAMAPGTSATISTSVTAITKLFLFLTPKRGIPVSVTVDGVASPATHHEGRRFDASSLVRPANPAATPGNVSDEAMVEVPLIQLAWARSGDKGNLFNVAVIARKAEFLAYIRAALSAERVADCYAHLVPEGSKPRVDAYDVPGFSAINFVVHDSLDGGLLVSPRADSAAKGMAQQLLELPVMVPAALAG